MGSSSTERLRLRWNDFESNIKTGFYELRQDGELFDVTIACGTSQIQAHKVILSACSPFFRSIIKSIPHSHPLLYLRGVKFSHLESLLNFMYNGEVNVSQEDLHDFLSVGEELKIKGLISHSIEGSSVSFSPNIQSSPLEICPPKRLRKIVPKKISESSPLHDKSSSQIKSEPRDCSELSTQESFSFEEEPISQFASENCDMLIDDSSHLLPGPSNLHIVNKDSFLSKETSLNEELDRQIAGLMFKSLDGLWNCDKCGKRSKLKRNISLHIESNHLVRDGFSCDLCKSLYKTRFSLKQHIHYKHL